MSRYLLNEAYLRINALLSNAYQPMNGVLRCRWCDESSPLHAGQSSFEAKHTDDCIAGQAIKTMRKIENLSEA
jgi:hypothetical protein